MNLKNPKIKNSDLAAKRPSEVRLAAEINWILKEKYDGKLTAPAKKDIVRLKKGEPVDYIIGFSEFLGCKIDLLFRPLIPRPETEFWAEKGIENIKKSVNKKIRCLDIFAGSGCVGIAILKHLPFTSVDFAEKNKKFLNQIKINVRLNKINARRYKVVQSDVFSNVAGHYDYIFANPPYVAAKNENRVQKSVLKWEPASAVFGGPDGMKFIKKFLKQAPDYLKRGGKIYMEFSPEQKNKIPAVLKAAGFPSFEFHKDQYGRWRYLTVNFA